MGLILPSGGSSPISADLLYQFYDNKAITPRVRAALQKREDEANVDSGSDSSANATQSNPAARLDITEEILRMNRASGTAKLEDLKSKVESSKEVGEIGKKLAEQEAAKKAEEEAQKSSEEGAAETSNEESA